jgi:outer membrane protein assembly factor BamB
MRHSRSAWDQVEAGAPRERRYYKRVRWIRATTSWGVWLLVSLSVPVAQQPQTLPIPPATARPTSPAATPAPAPVVDLYDEAWHVAVDAERPIHLAVTSRAVFIGGSSWVIARSLEDDHELWRTDALHPVTAVAADDDHVLVGANGALVSLDPTDGKIQWTTPQTGDPDQIVDRAGWVIASVGSALGAFRAKDGSAIWQRALGPAVVGAPSIDGDALFVLLADGSLRRMAIATGDVTWTTWLDAIASPPFAANDRVYVSLSDGHFEAFDQPDGHLLWPLHFSAPSIGAPISDTAHVYVAIEDNSVRAVDRHIGNQRWQAQLTERPASGPLLDGDHVLLPSASGEIGIVQGKNGHVLGHIRPPAAQAGGPGTTPRLIAVAIAPGGVIVRLVSNGDTTLTLAAYHRAAKGKKKPLPVQPNPNGLP